MLPSLQENVSQGFQALGKVGGEGGGVWGLGRLSSFKMDKGMFLYLRRSLLNEKISSKVYKNIELCVYVAWLAVLGQCTGQVQLYIIHTEREGEKKLAVDRKCVKLHTLIQNYNLYLPDKSDSNAVAP